MANIEVQEARDLQSNASTSILAPMASDADNISTSAIVDVEDRHHQIGIHAYPKKRKTQLVHLTRKTGAGASTDE